MWCEGLGSSHRRVVGAFIDRSASSGQNEQVADSAYVSYRGTSGSRNKEQVKQA